MLESAPVESTHGQAKSAVFLLSEIKANRLDPKQLKTRQRRICVRHLLDAQPELSQTQLAHILGTSQQSVSRYIHQIYEQDNWIVKKNDPLTWASRLIKNANISMTKLRQGGQWYLAHKVEMELTKELRELGVLPKIATPITVGLTGEAQRTFLEIVKLAVGDRPEEGDFIALG